MKKSTLIMVLSLVLAVAIGIGSTMAYLQDTDEDVNVMTLGNVYIEQHEYERVTDENGDPVKGVEGTDFDADYGIEESYKLKEFTQGKPAYPAVYQEGKMDWDEFQQLWNQVGAPGSNDLFDPSMKNVVDKFVFVENTGKSDAYYRTIIAIEDPEGLSLDTTTIHTSFNANSRFDYNSDKDGVQNAADSNKFYTVIDGTRYLVYVATYQEALTPDEVSRPSLLQLYLDPKATNDDVALFGETWDVLVVSQAVQTQGFADAQTALDEAFGPITVDNNPWKEDGKDLPNTPVFPVMVSTIDELSEALQNGAEDILYTGSSDIIIGDGIEFTNKANISFASAGKLVFEDGAKFVVEAGADVTITGAEIESNSDDEIFVVAGGAVLTLGKGTTIANCNNAMSSGLIRVYGDEDGTGKLVLDGAVIENNNNNGVGSLFNVSSNTEVVIEEGTVISGNIFTGKSSGDPNGLFDIYDGKVIMNGGEISGNSFENRTLINLEQNGEFIMNGGEIKNNTYAGADSGRSVIRLTRTTSFEMNGGTITGNVIPGSSASIININKANVNINDGDITGNTMTYAVYNFDGTVNVDGDATVEGDVYTW